MTIINMIGDKPNQVPRNKDLGSLAFQNKEGPRFDRLTVDDNLGVGTTAPTSRLHVSGGDGTGGISGPTSGTWAAKFVMNQDVTGYGGLSIQTRWANTNTPVFEVASGWNGGSVGYYPMLTINGQGGFTWKSNTGNEFLSAVHTGTVKVTGTLNVNGVFGYATGSGGTVTQLTDKGTAVTLNKACGQIVMHNAQLAAGATVTFTLNNTTIAATDVVMVNLGGNVGAYANYQAYCAGAGGGGAIISVRNVSGGALSEAIVLNFIVIKSVTS